MVFDASPTLEIKSGAQIPAIQCPLLIILFLQIIQNYRAENEGAKLIEPLRTQRVCGQCVF